MAIPIKYSVTAQPNAIKVGNFSIGVSREGFGPSAVSNYYNGRTPNAGGYTVFGSTGGTASCTIDSATGDDGLINLANQYGAGGVSAATGALNFFNTASTVASPGLALVCTNMDYPKIVTNGLILNLDAGYTPSYPRNGTAWKDIGPSGSNGALTSTTFGSSGGVYGIEFNGTTSRARVTSLEGTPFPQTAATISLWWYFDPSDTSAGGSAIFDTFDASRNSMFIRRGTASTVQYGFGNYGTVVTVYNAFFSASNTWRNLVMTFSAGVEMKAYLDGVFQSAFSLASYSAWRPTGQYVGIGNPNTTVSYKGKAATIQVYNKALSDAEITQNYLAGLQRFIPTDSMAISLDGNNTNTRIITPVIANDMSGNNLNGTIVNPVPLSTDGGTSFVFNGTNQYITFPSVISTTVFTVQCWIKSPNAVSGKIAICGNSTSGFGDDGFRIFINGVGDTSGKLTIETGNGAGSTSNSFTAGGVFTANTWQLFTFVLNRPATTSKLYKNASLQTTGGTTTAVFQVTNTVYVGTINTSFPLTGNIAEFKIYNRELTATEISTIYSATKSRYGL